MNNNNCLCHVFDDCSTWIIILALILVLCCCCNNRSIPQRREPRKRGETEGLPLFLFLEVIEREAST